MRNLLASFLEQIQSVRRFSDNTVRSYKNDLERFLSFCEENEIKPVNISKRTIMRYLDYLDRNKISKKSVNRHLSSLRAFFSFLVREETLEINPLTGIRNPKTEKRLPEIINTDQYDSILQSIDNLGSTREKVKLQYKVMFELLYGCSLRASEANFVRISDVDWFNSTVRILGKGNKLRIAPIGKKSITIFRQYLAEEPSTELHSGNYLITKSEKRLSPKTFYNIIHKFLSLTTEIKKKSPHILRHSSATHMLDKGADLMAIKEILGHTDLSTTQIYTRVSIERLKTIYKKTHPKS